MSCLPAITPTGSVLTPSPDTWLGGVSISLRVLRAALPALIEDPPFALGQSELARRLLPYERDVLRRGWALAELLRSAIACLRPEPAVPPSDRRWRSYQICSAEYIEGYSRDELEAQFSVSPTTYSRAKRRGLEAIAATLPYLLAQSPYHRATSARTTWRVLRGKRQVRKRACRD